MRRVLASLLIVACQNPGTTTGGLVVVSDTAMIGAPPECPVDGEDSGETGTGGETEPDEPDEPDDPGTSFCARYTSAAACDLTPRMDGDTVIGECHWVTVIPVLPGTCEATVLYETCVHVPVTGEDCAAPQSCGQVGLGVFGRAGCDGTIEVIVNPPGRSFCATPTDWPLCWGGDEAPECTCVCA